MGCDDISMGNAKTVFEWKVLVRLHPGLLCGPNLGGGGQEDTGQAEIHAG